MKFIKKFYYEISTRKPPLEEKKSLKTYIKVQFFDVITLIIVEAIKCDNKLIMRELEPS